METEKIGFFKRVKMSIFNLEKYSIFVNEKFSKALKYLFLLLLIVTTILAISMTVEVSKETGKLINYVKSDKFPDFEIKDGKMTSSSKLDSYDKEYDARLIIDTTENIEQEKIDSYKKEASNSLIYVIFLNDKIIYKFDEQSANGIESTYNNVTSLLGVKDISKEKLVNDYLNEDSLFKVKAVIFIWAFLSVLILNILTLIEDILIIGLFRLGCCKDFKSSFNISKNYDFSNIFFNIIYNFKYNLFSYILSYRF